MLLRINELDPFRALPPFRVDHNCQPQKAIQLLYEQGRKTYVAFLDVKKAFDTVWYSMWPNGEATRVSKGISIALH